MKYDIKAEYEYKGEHYTITARLDASRMRLEWPNDENADKLEDLSQHPEIAGIFITRRVSRREQHELALRYYRKGRSKTLGILAVAIYNGQDRIESGRPTEVIDECDMTTAEVKRSK